MKKVLVSAMAVTLIITGVSLVVFIASVMLGWFHIGFLVNLMFWMGLNVCISIMVNKDEYDYIEEKAQPKKRANLKYRKIEG